MGLIERRPYGYSKDCPHGLTSSHRVVCGWKGPGKKPGETGFPVRLGGLLVCRDSVGPDKRPLIDFGAMAMLGYDKAKVTKALTAGEKPQGLLPTELHFRLPYDLDVVDGQVDLSNIYREELQYNTKKFRYCYGNGVTAMRMHSAGHYEQVACIPAGSGGNECEFSKQGKCKCKFRILTSLFVPGKNGDPVSLSKAFNWEARYRFDSTSHPAAMEMIAELVRATKIVGGSLYNLTGIMAWQRHHARKGPEGGAVIVPRVSIRLSEAAIAKRELENYQRLLELHDRDQRLQLTGPAHQEANVNGTPPVDPTKPVQVTVEEEQDDSDDCVPDETVTPEEVVDPPTEQGPPQEAPAPPIDLPEVPGEQEEDKTITVADAVPDDLIESLIAFAEVRGEPLSNWTRFVYTDAEGNKQEESPNDPAFYFEAKTEDLIVIRQKLLRNSCQYIENRLEMYPEWVLFTKHTLGEQGE